MKRHILIGKAKFRGHVAPTPAPGPAPVPGETYSGNGVRYGLTTDAGYVATAGLPTDSRNWGWSGWYRREAGDGNGETKFQIAGHRLAPDQAEYTAIWGGINGGRLVVYINFLLTTIDLGAVAVGQKFFFGAYAIAGVLYAYRRNEGETTLRTGSAAIEQPFTIESWWRGRSSDPSGEVSQSTAAMERISSQGLTAEQALIESASTTTVATSVALTPTWSGTSGAETISFSIGLSGTAPAPGPAPGPIPAPPSASAYTIYNNPASPRPISQYLVGMHLHRFPAAMNPSNPSPAPTYRYGMVRSLNTEGLAWADINTANGVYDWTKMDAWVATHYAAGRRLIYTVIGCPVWAAKLPGHPSPYGRNGYGSAPSSQAYLSDFVTELMTRFGAKIWGIQYSNEWDRAFFDFYSDGQGALDYYIGDVAGNEAGKAATRQSNLARDTATVSVAAKAVVPGAVMILGGFIYWTDSAAAQSDFIALTQVSVSAGGTLADYIDAIGFHFYDNEAVAADALLRYRALVATRDAIRASLKILIDETGTLEGSGLTAAQHSTIVRQRLMMAAGFGLEGLILYSHENETLGTPASSPTVSTAIDEMYGLLVASGKTVARAEYLADGSTWIAFSDGSQAQHPIPDVVEPPAPEPGVRDALVNPFASTSPWVHTVTDAAVYGGTATQLTQLRTWGTMAVSPSTATNNMWAKPIAIGRLTDPIQRVGVYNSGTGELRRVIEIRIPVGFRPSDPPPSWNGSIPPYYSSSGGGDAHGTIWWRDSDGTPYADEFYGMVHVGGFAGYDYLAKAWTRVPLRGHGIGFGGKSPAGGFPEPKPWSLAAQGNFVMPAGPGWEDAPRFPTEPGGAASTSGSVRAYGGSASAGTYTFGDFDGDYPKHAASVAIPHRSHKGQDANSCDQSVWPARRNDCRAYNPDGTLMQGMLFAIPWDENIDAMPISANAKKVGKQWRAHGLIVVDQSSTSVGQDGSFLLYCNPAATAETQIMLELRNNGDLQYLRNRLKIITNNTAATRHGGGTPRIPLLSEVY